MAEQPNGLDEQTLQDLRSRVRGWISEKGQKQSALATDCGVNAADLTHFLSGERPLPTFALSNLARILGLDVAEFLLRWECSQYRKRAGETNAEGSQNKAKGWELARNATQALLDRLPRTSGEIHESPHGPASLADWPSGFQPVVVFAADRRETPPSSPADLLAVSGSMGDLFYLPRLRLPPSTEVRSDKTCVIASEDSLKARLASKNLLIIGSPAANLVARSVNSGACFSFYVTSEALDQSAQFQTLLSPIRYLPGELERYAGVNSRTREETEWSRRRRHMIYGFARSGILDPIAFEGPRGTSIPAHADYGVVCLAHHPWSENRIAIIAAGLHGPATAAAVKLLATDGAFDKHPLGGVFRVHVPIDAPWEERYDHLEPQWETHDYTIAEYSAAVEAFAEKRKGELAGPLRFWDPSRVRSLLRQLAPDRPDA